MGILISYYCSTKLPQTQWLKAIYFYFTAVEFRSPKSVPESKEKKKKFEGLPCLLKVLDVYMFTCLFQLLFLFFHLWTYFTSMSTPITPIVTFPSLTHIALPHSCKKHPCDYTGQTGIIQDLNIVTFAKFLFPFHIIYSQILEIKHGYLWSFIFIIVDGNAKVGSQEIPGVTGKFGLGIQNEAGQRLIEFCQENALVIRNILFQQHKRRL